MKALIIGGTRQRSDDGVREYYQKYIDFFKKSADRITNDATVTSCLMDDLIISVGDGEFTIYDARNKRDLSEYDVLFMRGDGFRAYMDVIGTINEYAHLHNTAIINDYSDVRDSSKLLQAVHFSTLNIPVARTVYVNSALIEHEASLNWSFPCIMKATHGSHGNDNYIVTSMDEVRMHLGEQPEKHFVLQRLIPNNGDYRLLIIGDGVLVIGRSAQDGSHLNNTSKGGRAVIVDINTIPPQVIERSKAIMRHLRMTIAGVDVLADKHTNEFFFLEVNAQPQLMSGAFIEEKERLMGMLFGTLSHQS